MVRTDELRLRSRIVNDCSITDYRQFLEVRIGSYDDNCDDNEEYGGRIIVLVAHWLDDIFWGAAIFAHNHNGIIRKISDGVTQYNMIDVNNGAVLRGLRG